MCRDERLIQRLVPEVTLDKVSDPMSLLPALTNDVLDKTAKLFGVQRAWLDGVTDRMYPPRSCYQDPRRFFEEFESLVAPKVRWHRLLAFCDDPKLDMKSAKRRTIVLVFVEHLSEWDDGDEIVRYRPLTEPWYWDYGKSRIQLKAMLRAAYDHLDVKVVRLIKVDHQVLAALDEGKVVPPHEIKEREVSLEDYNLSDAESKVAKETDELDHVMGYMQDLKIDQMAKKVADRKQARDQEPPPAPQTATQEGVGV
jgi:hypothetical protein